jgi:phage nucleotide-binding protein
MDLKHIEANNLPYTALLYCKAGVGKSTALGLISERTEGNMLVLDIDRTIMRTLAKQEIVKNTKRVLVEQVENRGRNDAAGIKGTFAAWTDTLHEITPAFLKENNITTVAVDNISELERCILSDLGAQGKNKGVPAMADYQYMQFNLVNSLRYMKSWGVNVVWTAWETAEAFTHPDGSQYTRLMPKISAKILDNICGLCDVVGWIGVNKDGEHMILLKPTQNIYAKNQVDCRDTCKVEDFALFNKTNTKKEG